MKKQLHGVFLIIVGYLAIIASILTIADLSIKLYNTFLETSYDYSIFYEDGLVMVGIELMFAILEVSAGAKIIKNVNKNEHFETYSSIPKLIRSIITPLFLFEIYEIIFYLAFAETKELKISSILLAVCYIAINIVSSFTRAMVTKRNIKGLNNITLILSIASLCYIIFSYETVFKIEDETINLICNIVNTFSLIFVLLFAITISNYYKKHPDEEKENSLENADYEIIKENNSTQTTKFYQTRSSNSKMNKFIKTLNIIIGLLSLSFTIWFFINHYLSSFIGINIENIITNLLNPDSCAVTIISILITLVYLIPIIINIIGIVNIILGAITTNAKHRFKGYYIIDGVTFYGFSVIFDFLMSNIFSLDQLFVEASLGKLILTISLIILIVFSQINAKLTKELNEDLLNGECYAEILKKQKIIIYFESLVSILTIVGLIVENGFDYDYSLYLQFVITIFFVISTILEVKYPCEESITINKKKS